MASDLVAICDALASQTISFTSPDGIDYAIEGTPMSDVQDRVGVLPARLILPPGAYGPGVVDYQTVNFGNAVTVVWSIVDMLLFEAVPLGQMIGVKYASLTAYVAAYIPTLNTTRKLDGKPIVRITPNVGVIEYPRSSGYYYNGVQMLVNVSETICP